ncbi:MAG: DUF4859 domain-containing protein [Salinivirgaceae bacterium]|nr:DUF4859 domain-containing protein [Salinivirgaceae bacterium]
MKKIYYVLILFAFMAGLTTNCKDDDGGGVIPPADTTMWDHVLEYPVEITMSATSYDGTQVEIDFATIASYLGISKEDLLLSMADSITDPDVTLYAIGAAATEDVVVGTAKNTNGIWGHWWDADGVNCEWGETAMVFAEYFSGDEFISIGQYPGHLTNGQVVEFYECIKYNDIRVACHFTITAKEPEEIVATIVNTQQLSLEVLEKTTYDLDSVAFNLDQTLTDLGVSSMDEVTLIAVNEDGSYAQEKSADNGYWIDRNGYASGWGAGGVVYTDYGTLSSNMVGIGQFPDSLSAGETFTIKFGFLANDKIEMLAITITVAGYVDPETTPTGDPIAVDTTITISQPYSADWAGSSADIQATLRNAFKMTTYQIFKAINEGTMVFTGYNADGTAYTDSTGAVVSTANYPGHWFAANGNVTVWGDTTNPPAIYCEMGRTEESLQLNVGHHPDNVTAGTAVTIKQKAELNGGSVTFTVVVNVQ